VKHSAALEALARRHALDAHQQEQLAEVLAALARDERAPTTVRSPEQALDVHLADSLSALVLEPITSAGKLADLGSGAGFPGVPLAVALPASRVTLLESQRRKCGFLERLIARCAITNATVVCARAEDWREGIEAHDVVSARALAPQAVVLEYAAPLLKRGGALVDWRGRREQREEARSARAAAELGLELVGIRRAEPFGGAREHHLHVFAKTGETPARFPRRPGIARKRPLGC
jgi:16S rRNA (guanine527-N7)-methyltransferase